MAEGDLIHIEPDQRLLVLARTIEADDPNWGTSPETGRPKGADLAETCLGQALYRHRSVFQNASDTPVWSHLELSYFRDILPACVVRDLVFGPLPAGGRLLRAEILLTTPRSFVLPRDWKGLPERPELQASLEYLDVRPAHLGAYRDIMKRYVGPAAARLVGSGRFGTFRAMETTAVLYQDSRLDMDWNQIHLCEVDPAGFRGFGQEFDAALREISPDGGFAGVFAGLGPMRTIPRWTFNDAVVEADLALGLPG